ncbi:hypothetical protein RHOSPDRAFT_37322 [Rhodotorula sp. JG-1b]|nr:hypothetical protein RHOSPDRAFT_37322 [Rhodotorula sp. JG-1b]
MPTRNKHGCIVMVKYDHLLLQHLRAGHKVDSFDTRKLRRRPTLSPRERWLRVQNYLLTYDVIDETLMIPTRPAHARRSPSPRPSPSSSRSCQTPAGESSTARISEPPGTTAVADARPSENRPSLSPKRIAGEIPPAGAAEASTSKIPTDPSSVEPTPKIAADLSVQRTSASLKFSSPATSPDAPCTGCEPAPPSEVPHEPSTIPIAAHSSLETSPCSVSSPPPSSSSSSSSQPPLASSTNEPFSFASASTTTDSDPKGNPRTLALFDEAIDLCRRFCKLVEEGRNKRQEAAESGREGGGT